ncbi:alpha/beta hydrolase [Amycolatopsis samaneae]|uniref:Alpha/beta hydrolase n=1 Tax=Amycolatopsis samaneae TaxID=664691 RepID=A0ABW5GP83_9PSEU
MTRPTDIITSPPPIAWRASEDDETAEQGVITVPVDWTAPDGPTMERTVFRRRARRQDERIGVLFIRYFMPLEFEALRLSDTLKDRFDLVGFDPWPQNCAPAGKVPSSGPRNAEEYQRLREYVAARTRETLDKDPATVLHADAVSDARDIEVVRRALCEEQLNFISSRENELVGQHYCELYGDRVRTMVLDGNLDHSVTTLKDYLVAKAGAVNDVFLAFADWAERTPGNALYGLDARATFLEARERWRRKAPIIGERLMTAKVGGMVDPAEQPGEHNWHGLAKIVLDAAEGTLDPRNLDEPLTIYASFGADFGFQTPAWDDVLDIKTAMAERAPYSLNNPMQWGNAMGIQGWSAPVVNPPRPLVIDRPLPVLVVRTRFDPGQPYEWGESVASQIPGATVITYEGAGTTAYNLSRPAREAIDDFLTDLTPPAATSFPAVWPS